MTTDRPLLDPCELLRSFLNGDSVEALCSRYQLRTEEVENLLRLGFKVRPSAFYI